VKITGFVKQDRLEAGKPVKTEKQKMLAGEIYRVDAELHAEQMRQRELMNTYNTVPAHETDKRRRGLEALFGSVGEGSVVRSPVYVDYGSNIRLGAGVFLNFGCELLDVVAIEIGDKTQIGPNVQILTADHPRDPVERETGVESGIPVKIGRNVWIGAGAIILPGVTVGDDAIIGAGAVVSRNVPKGATAAGNPARVLPPKAKNPA
jgi:maltose O-acetyltransferase